MNLTQEQQKKLKKVAKLVDFQSKGATALLEYLFELDDKYSEDIPELGELIEELQKAKPDRDEVKEMVSEILEGSKPDYEEIAKLVVVEHGKDYVLTEQDKIEIASKIEAPVVDKVIEKTTETIIREQPIEIIKEVAVLNPNDLPQYCDKFRDGLELLQEGDKLSIDAIENLRKELDEVKKVGGKHVVSTNRNLYQLLDVDVSGITTDQSIKWDGQKWIPYTATSSTPTLQQVTNVGADTTHSIEAESFVTTDGTSDQFVKGDGSLDSNTYLTSSALSSYVPYTGATGDLDLGANKLSITGKATTGDVILDITAPTGDNLSFRKGINITAIAGASNGAYYGLYVNVQNHLGNYGLYIENGLAYINGRLDMNFNPIINLGNIEIKDVYSSTRGNLFVGDTTSTYVSGNGGNTSFWGDDRGQGFAVACFAGIRGIKETNTYLDQRGALVFQVNQTPALDGRQGSVADLVEVGRFSSDGYFGINTTNPTHYLDVNGDANITGAITLGDDLTMGVFKYDASLGQLFFGDISSGSSSYGDIYGYSYSNVSKPMVRLQKVTYGSILSLDAYAQSPVIEATGGNTFVTYSQTDTSTPLANSYAGGATLSMRNDNDNYATYGLKAVGSNKNSSPSTGRAYSYGLWATAQGHTSGNGGASIYGQALSANIDGLRIDIASSQTAPAIHIRDNSGTSLFKTTVNNSTGAVTFDSIGSGAGFTFSDAVSGTTFNGVALTTGGTSTKYLSEDGTYTTPAGGSGLTQPQVLTRTLGA